MTDGRDIPTQASGEIPALPMSVGKNDRFLAAHLLDAPGAPGEVGRIDRFAILRKIGAGGMGVVFESRHPVTGAPVALKVLRPELADNPVAAQRFLTEARHMSRLSHRNILKVLDLSDRTQGPYYVMPFMVRGSLADLLAVGKLPDAHTTLRVARYVAEALAHAHQKGIIHRDLKPANVLLDEEGHACIADFGMVRTLFNDAHIDIRQDQREGTPAYMSPGVAAGAVEDTRCDIYAFGAALYEMLTGHTPYEGETSTEVLGKIAAGPPERIVELNPHASPGLVKIAEGAMARELRDRYSSMADVLADLERADKRRLPLGPHGHETWGLPRRWIVAAAVLMTIGIAGGIGMRLRGRAVGAAQSVAHESVPRTAEPRMRPTFPIVTSALQDAYSLAPPPLETRIDAQGHRVVNLMPLIDVSRDGLTGVWRKTDGGVSCEKLPGIFGNLRIPYDPPAEFDFRIEFSRTSGEDDVDQISPVNGTAVFWCMGMRLHGGMYNGFLRGGFDPFSTDGPTQRMGELINGHRYISVVQVRRNSVAAILDGKKLVDYATDFRDMKAGDPGIGGSEFSLRTRECTVAFHSIEVVEVSGRGKPWAHATDDPDCVRVLTADTPIHRACFTSGGGSIFGAPLVGLIIWDLKHPGQFQRTGSGPQENCSAISPDGRYAISPNTPGWLGIDAGAFSHGEKFAANSSGAGCGDFSRDGSMAAVALRGEYPVRIYDASAAPSFTEIKRLPLPEKTGQDGFAVAVRFSPDGRRLAVATRWGPDSIRLFDIKTGTEMWHDDIGQPLYRLSFDSGGDRITGTSGDKLATVWDVATGHAVASCAHRTNVSDTAFSNDGRFLFTADSDPGGTLHVWDISTGSEIERFKAIIPVNGLALSQDGHRLLAACADWTVRLFDADTGKQLHRYVGHDKAVNCIAFSPDEKNFASASDDRTVRIWKISASP